MASSRVSAASRAISLHVLLFASIGLAGCTKPEPPRVTPKAVRVAAVGPVGLDIAIELDVYNPNSFALRAQSVDGALLLGEGVELGKGHAAPEFPIPGKQSAMVASTVSIPWTTFGALTPFVTSNQPVPYKFVGNARIGGERLTVSIPFELRGELSRAQLVEIGLRGLTTPPQP